MKKYFLKKGNTIGKPGLPGGKLEAKQKDLAIKPELVKVLERNMHHFVKAGKVRVEEILDEAQSEKEAKKAKKQAEKEAKELADKEAKEAAEAQEKSDELNEQE